MDIQTAWYCRALRDGDPSLLAHLADRAGYRFDFNPLRTRLLANGDFGHEYDDSAILSDRDPEEPPADHWSGNYQDVFTRVKVDTKGCRFVDCWMPKQTQHLAITAGRFPENGAERDDLAFDMARHISTIRSAYAIANDLRRAKESQASARRRYYISRAATVSSALLVYYVTKDLTFAVTTALGFEGNNHRLSHGEKRGLIKPLTYVETDEDAVRMLVRDAWLS